MLRSTNRLLRRLLCAASLLLVTVAASAQQAYDLPEVLSRGQLRVAFYKEFAPFSDDGKGIDVDIAQLLASKLGVKMVPMWFDADESMEDDLRNMVWKGHYLGYGPADVMIHVPVDKDYMARNDKVSFFAPYYRERFAIARNTERIAKLESMEPFRAAKIGVEGGSYPDTVLLSADAGAYRSSVVHFKTTGEALQALKAGEVSAVMAMQGELEAGIHGLKGFEISEPPLPLINRRQWPLGMAVKAGNDELAKALQKGMNELVAEGKIAALFDRYGVKYRAP